MDGVVLVANLLAAQPLLQGLCVCVGGCEWEVLSGRGVCGTCARDISSLPPTLLPSLAFTSLTPARPPTHPPTLVSVAVPYSSVPQM